MDLLTRTHRVQYGDTLASLAKLYYGDETLYAYIYQHNRHYIAQMNQLSPGQVLTIPFLPVRKLLQEFC
jgi:nucleoid-associated protein YgaU